VYYLCHFVVIKLEMSHEALSSSVFDKLENTKLLRYNYIQDQTHLYNLYWVIQVYSFNGPNSSFQWCHLILINVIRWPGIVGLISKCIYNCRNWFRCCWLHKCWVVLRLLTMFALFFFGLSCCWSLNKNNRSVIRTFTRDISKCLLK